MVLVAAYQAPLAATRSQGVLQLIAGQVARCEAMGARILCCPEGALGGLADYVEPPDRLVFAADGLALTEALAPLASPTVTTIVGYTERDTSGRLFNAAAVLHRGAVLGRYRKLHPAIRSSVYTPGDTMPVFTVESLTFGVLLCRDSSFAAPARVMASRGAVALFVPSNNGLPASRAHPGIIGDARRDDVARATENGVSVIRADVAGSAFGLRSYGTTGIVAPDGRTLAEARRLAPDLVVADIPLPPRSRNGARITARVRLGDVA